MSSVYTDLSDFDLRKLFPVLLHRQAVTFFSHNTAEMFYCWLFINPSPPFERILFTLGVSYGCKNHVAASIQLLPEMQWTCKSFMVQYWVPRHIQFWRKVDPGIEPRFQRREESQKSRIKKLEEPTKHLERRQKSEKTWMLCSPQGLLGQLLLILAFVILY